MLKQIDTIKGVGLFHDSGASPIFGRVALIYGENGRGKSTLASVLHSCEEGHGAALAPRATLDGTLAQYIHLTFEIPNSSNEPVQFSGTTWSKPVPYLKVFDAEFVSRNIYAGTEIKAEQRASLLEFSLGEQAVALRKKVDEVAAELTDASAKLNTQTAILKARAGKLSVDAFLTLAAPKNADEQIVQIEKRIAAASARDELLKKNLPTQALQPVFDATKLFEILSRSLPEVEEIAEQAVQHHLKKCTHPNFEQWVAQGGIYIIGDECPYCGSSIKENNLIRAYRTHFNKAYHELKSETAQLEDQVSRRLSDEVVDNLERAFETAQAHIDGWKGYVDQPPIAFNAAAMKSVMAQLRSVIEPLASAKARQPLESIGSKGTLEQAINLWASAINFVTGANTKIAEANTAIEAYKKTLATEDVSTLRATIETLRLAGLRHTPDVVAEANQLDFLIKSKKAKVDEKDTARKELDALMTSTLKIYQIEINTILSGFGAQIRIENLSFDYRGAGGLPRSDYRLKLRGREVKLSGNGAAAFGNTLSEGDKRSLAFAFFIARLHQDPQLSNHVVVIDDPMCSLDRTRRTATIRLLKVLATKCRQLIVLAHDPFFLQALDDDLRKLSPFREVGAISYCKIVRAGNEYSDFGCFTLDQECASQYENDLSTIIGYVEAKAGIERSHVAKCLRVVLETSLRQQFPSYIKRGSMLGEVITSIEKATSPSPLAALNSSVKELRSINDYAKAFHHTEDETQTSITSIDETELLGYCNRVLQFIFRG